MGFEENIVVKYLLDKNILIVIFKKDYRLFDWLNDVNYKGEKFFIICIIYFESEGGLLVINF